jgi:hypothetical protein
LSNSNENGAGTSAGTAGTKAIDYLRSVYQNPLQPDNVRMRAAAIAIEYELPRFAVTAMVSGGGDFADQLDQAVQRTRRVLMIEAKPITNVSSDKADNNTPSDTKRPVSNGDGHKPSTLDRRYRRW